MGEIDDIFGKKKKNLDIGKDNNLENGKGAQESAEIKKRNSDELGNRKGQKVAVRTTEPKDAIPIKTESKASKKTKKEFKIPEPKRKDKIQVEEVDFSAKPQPKKPKIVDPDDDGFADSRGTKPRKQTEDGLPIYLDTELNVGLEGGETPQCPFDCQCCF
ncbi:hypothetical protein HDV01_000044 [Terramyces sp. JEL0728]|nr:hypothetical protein HDV01_000044 [Terramyces sp. JEL0728]